MSVTRLLPLRFWTGPLPTFHLLNERELQRERDASEAFFGSVDVASLRTRVRLKLTETPLVTQVRRPAAQYAELIELVASLLPHALALLRFVHTHYPPCSTPATWEGTVGDVYPLLFYGLGDLDLRADRLVGREARVGFTVPIEVVLLFFLQGQLHGLHAEALVDQGIKLQSQAIVESAELSWRQSTLYFTRAAELASATTGRTVAGDPLVSSLIKFYNEVASLAIVLARIAQVLRASCRVLSLVLVEEMPERLARNAVICSRYAFAVAQETADVTAVLADSSCVGIKCLFTLGRIHDELTDVLDIRFARQLTWLIKGYSIRWKALYFRFEQDIFQLDAYPEIAIHYCQMLLRERLPPIPDYPHRRDAYFTQVAQDLQLAHAAHLNETMDEKTNLLELCQRKLGALWALEVLPRELEERVSDLSAFEHLYDDEAEYCGTGDVDAAFISSIAGNVESNIRTALERNQLECSSLSAYSLKGNYQATHDQGPKHSNRVSASGGGCNDERGKSTFSSTRSAVDIDTSQEEVASTALSIGKGLESPMKRPSSAHSHPAQAVSSDSEWITLNVGGRRLHFEKTRAPPRPATAGAVGRRRNAVPMAIDDAEERAQNYAAMKEFKKHRPTSSPSYLNGKQSKRGGAGTDGALTWVPNRVSCALCERRFMRQNLPGVVVMKRIFDLRRKWGMVIQDSKKFSAASALYGRASVCVMCQDILTFEDEQILQKRDERELFQREEADPVDDIGIMIHNRIKHSWSQQPPLSDEMLLDVAVNKRARQSSINFGLVAQNAVQADSIRTAHTKEEYQPWWEVDLANYHVVHSVKIWLREDISHIYSIGGNGNGTRKAMVSSRLFPGQGKPGDKADVLAMSSIGFLQSGTGHGIAGSLAPAPQPNLGLYPLHVCISMKGGATRDFEDVVASAVSSHCVREKAAQPLVWIAPPNCRGRFVRIQSEGTAFLHIEKVNVFVAHDIPTIPEARTRRDNARSLLKRAAFRASVVSKPVTKGEPEQETTFNEKDATLAAITFGSSSAQARDYGDGGNSRSFLSSLADPAQAEKRRVSRLYMKFKSLLDARTKYSAEDRLNGVTE